MDNVPMIIIALLIVLYPKRGTYISCIKFRCGLKGTEFEMSTKEKSDPPCKSSRSNLKQ